MLSEGGWGGAQRGGVRFTKHGILFLLWVCCGVLRVEFMLHVSCVRVCMDFSSVCDSGALVLAFFCYYYCPSADGDK